MDVFKILAAILHLGNVQITAVGNERSFVDVRSLFVSPCLCWQVCKQIMVTLLLHFGTRHSGPTAETSFMGTRKQGFPWVDFKEESLFPLQ